MEGEDAWCLAHAAGSAGAVQFQRGATVKAELLLRESVAVSEAIGDTYIVRTTRLWLGRGLLASGDYTEGKALLEIVIESAREAGDTFTLPMALSILGTEIAVRGDERVGLAHLEEAATIARRVGLPRRNQLAMALWMKGLLLLAKQDTSARLSFDELLRIGVERGDAYATFACAGLAMVDVLDKDLNSAEVRLQEALATMPPGYAFRSFVTMAAGAIARARGDLDTALTDLQEALAGTPRGADGPALLMAIAILEMLAGVLLASGQVRDGVRLLAATHAARAHHRLAKPQSNEDDPVAYLAAARPLIGAEETAKAWAHGLAMSITDTIAFVQSERA